METKVLQLENIVFLILGILCLTGNSGGTTVTALVVGLFVVEIFAVTYVWRVTRDRAAITEVVLSRL